MVIREDLIFFLRDVIRVIDRDLQMWFYKRKIRMKKLVFALFCLFFLILPKTFANAQKTSIVKPITPPSTVPSYFGQEHAYSVTLRGNGEAVVFLKAMFSNTNSLPLSELFFRVMKVNPTDVMAFQVLLQPRCIQYGERAVGIDLAGRPNLQIPCLQYQEPDYFSYWREAKYQKASVEYRGDTIILTLPQPVKENATGGILLYYRAMGYAKKQLFGSYDFSFETLKIEDKIRKLMVGISTDSDLVIRGAKASVNYRFTEPISELKSAMAESTPVANRELDALTNQIGYGAITKTASNLASLESYSVKGSFADSSFKLYAKEMMIAIAVFLVIALIIGLGIRKIIQVINSKNDKMSIKSSSENFSSSASGILAVFGLSFLSSFFLCIIIICIILVNGFLRTTLQDIKLPLSLLIALLGISLCLISCVGPAFYLGVRRGLLWGVSTFILTILWLFIDLILGMIILFTLNTGRTFPPYQIMPMIQKSILNNQQKNDTVRPSSEELLFEEE